MRGHAWTLRSCDVYEVRTSGPAPLPAPAPVPPPAATAAPVLARLTPTAPATPVATMGFIQALEVTVVSAALWGSGSRVDVSIATPLTGPRPAELACMLVGHDVGGAPGVFRLDGQAPFAEDGYVRRFRLADEPGMTAHSISEANGRAWEARWCEVRT